MFVDVAPNGSNTPYCQTLFIMQQIAMLVDDDGIFYAKIMYCPVLSTPLEGAMQVSDHGVFVEVKCGGKRPPGRINITLQSTTRLRVLGIVT